VIRKLILRVAVELTREIRFTKVERVFFGEWNLAARLYGAAEAQRERIGHHPEPREEVFIERAREALGAIAFAAAESDGRSLSYDEAIAQARAWLDEGS